MGKFTELVKQAKSLMSKEVRTFKASDKTPIQNLALLPVWYFSSNLGVPRGVNVVELRQYEKSAWVQMVLNTISRQIMTTDWDIVTTDEGDDVEQYKDDIKTIKQLLNYPNRNGATFWDIWGPFARDVMSTDAGVVLKGYNNANELKELFAYEGTRFLINVNEYGIIGEDQEGNEAPGYYQYSFKQPGSSPIPFMKNQIVYGRLNTNTEFFPYGFSPLQSIQQEVELMIQGTRFNKEFFINNAIPDGIVSVETDVEGLEDFRNGWEQQTKGQAHKLVFHNSNAAFTELAKSNKDMEWLEGQKWYFHVVFGAYGVSPMEAGFFEDGNRATGDSQERVTVKNAIKPYLTLIESKINRDIIPELINHDKLTFKWFPKDDVAEKLVHEQMMAKLTANVYTINEVRAEEGKDPVEWGDEPMQMVMQDRFVENGGTESFDGKKETFGNAKPKKDDVKEQDKNKPKENEEDGKKLYRKLFKGFMLDGKQ